MDRAPDVGDFEGLSRDQAIALLRTRAAAMTLEQRFTLLHRLGIYAGEESASGDGSSLAETRALRAALPALLAECGVERLLDVPCGDFHWMRHVDLGGVEYLGADIVASIVADNQARHARAGRSFRVLDVTRDPLPAADLVLCRDLLIHLGLDDIHRTLANLARSGARWLLASHFPRCRDNAEIPSGAFRRVNLCRPPFGLPEPRRVISEESTMAGGEFPDRSMGLWRLDRLGLAP